MVVNDRVSEFKDLSYGVPQGSVLGPLLFLIYIHDMSLIFPDTRIYQYVDDTVLSISADSQLETLKKMEQEEPRIMV